jgi:2-oxoglutarate dehydrogenase E2 component (dihydrolipoamide succinyltransferase)
MSVEVKVPQLGESVVEATVGRWLKKEGDSVSAGDALVELETDKVNIEVPAEQSGVLQSILKQEGETVSVGDSVAVLSNGGAAAAPSVSVSAEPASEPAGEAADNGATAGGDSPSASPVARALAAENHVDLRQVPGSGAGGKVTKEDVEAYLRSRGTARPAEASAAPAAPVVPPPAAPNVVDAPAAVKQPPVQPAPAVPAAAQPSPSSQSSSGGRPEERIRMSRRRLTIMARLKEAQNTAAMLTTFNEIDMSAVMELRKGRKDAFKERHGVNLGFMSFFTKAVIGALKAFPMINAEIQGTDIVLKKYYDIGVAVSTEEGLVVPVVRDADKKTFADIERDIVDLATRARGGKLSLPELQGGTFTITNGGIFGSLMSTPILNTPQVGILGMHTIQERPVIRNGEIVARPMMYVALSYDHRIVDGSEAVRFLVRVKELVEDPLSLMLEG